MATLEVLKSQERSSSDVPLLKPTTTFGRDAKCDVRLKWDGFSRLHFSIHGQLPDGSGLPTRFELVDEGNGCNNGVFVNNRRVTRTMLKDGDIISIGRGRDVHEGGKIADHNIECMWALRTMQRSKGAGSHGGKGRLQENLADKGHHRHLRGQSRHPLGGHKTASDQRDKKEQRSEQPAGEVVKPSRALVYCPSDYTPSPADDAPPRSHLQLEFVYGIRAHDLASVVYFVDEERIIYPAGALVVLYDLATNTQV
jgi:hypothetical protein